MSPMSKTIAKRLSTLRGDTSYAKAADMTGVSATMLWRLETRDGDVPLSILVKIAKAYGVTVAYLIGESEAA